MDLDIGPEYDGLRQQVRSFLDRHRDLAVPAGPGSGATMEQRLAWQDLLVDGGWVGRTIPERYGGAGQQPDLLGDLVIEEEFRRAGVSQGIANQGISMFVPTLLHYGDEEQKQLWVEPTMRGRLLWCQGYSEPGSGSDLASLQTRGRRDGDDYVINGQKIWTSTAQIADMMFGLIRTEPEAGKHGGISYMVIPMQTPGIEVRPMRQMTGESDFNEVFFTDARVPAGNVIGEPGQGWEIGTATLRFERDMLGRSAQAETFLDGAERILRETGKIDHPVWRDRLMRLRARALAMKFHRYRMLTDRLRGRDSGASGLITKLNGCQLNYDICALAIDAMGERGILRRGSAHVRDDGEWQIQYMYALGLIIGGGTAQIQKNIIAQRGLGLPRSAAKS
ncbi:MAG: acyl-CoA dehydrogenase [Acidobacteria bacterium]|nr:MAG: acyl-CoA dehydrogenase [Acidobacteriota bacterium]REK08879.1 MAG: acyl-CoA dehydrogenase [Acidobacteriota bacterium]